MSLFQLISLGRKKTKRVGRGISAGKGKTAGRGTKGQRSRTGFNLPQRFEGGQTSLIARLPKKKGFTRNVNLSVTTVNALRLTHFKSGDVISPKTLYDKGIIDNKRSPIKIVGSIDALKGIKFNGVSFSKNKKNVTAPSKAKA